MCHPTIKLMYCIYLLSMSIVARDLLNFDQYDLSNLLYIISLVYKKFGKGEYQNAI